MRDGRAAVSVTLCFLHSCVNDFMKWGARVSEV